MFGAGDASFARADLERKERIERAVGLYALLGDDDSDSPAETKVDGKADSEKS